ncbi:hypothetical protein CANCADRAFT_108993 [Tortispora caseinolytica NRRL Y-17796]|uniref:Conserved oligomeric Golgi complex subunit 3 n=1 Tax=Tortispora caseinolytica NRRL Y-17796 TaxID=767744 RepID=A0A1E4TG59_9ASCO|nr:hypothetical protein CANCADRAFT_108993 [Tortispora caseinolytica NRRL Y-17796]
MFEDWALTGFDPVIESATRLRAPSFHSAQPKRRTRTQSLIQDVAYDRVSTSHISVINASFDAIFGHSYRSSTNAFVIESITASKQNSASDKPPLTSGPSTELHLTYPFSRTDMLKLYLKDLEIDTDSLCDQHNCMIDALRPAVAYRDGISSVLAGVNRVSAMDEECISLLADARGSLKNVLTRTKAIDSSYNEVIHEIEMLQAKKTEISRGLTRLSSLNSIVSILNAPPANFVKSSRFVEIVDDIAASIRFFTKHPTFKDADKYRLRFSQCMIRSLTLVRVYTTKYFKHAYQTANQSTSAPKDTPISVVLSQTILPFELDAVLIKERISKVRQCAEFDQSYQDIYYEIMTSYFDARKSLILPVLTKEIYRLRAELPDLIEFVRELLSLYHGICDDEMSLFSQLFQGSESEFYDYLQALSSPLNDSLRYKVLHEQNIDVLCELCRLLQSHDSRDNRSIDPAVSSKEDVGSVDFSSITLPTLQDVQSRLIFRTMAFMDRDILRYNVKPEDVRLSGVSNLKPDGDTPPTEQSNPEGVSISLYGAYPPLRRAVRVLSQIYMLVDSVVFDDLAHQIVHICIESLLKASLISQKIDGKEQSYLFIIKHLLILKDQIVAFDISTVRPESDLDFSEIAMTFQEIMQSGGFFTAEGLKRLARSGIPKLVKNMPDARLELDGRLRETINNYTDAISERLCQPLKMELSKDTSIESISNSLIRMRSIVQDCMPEVKMDIYNAIKNDRVTAILVEAVENCIEDKYEIFYKQCQEIGLTCEDLWTGDELMVWLHGLLPVDANDDEYSVSDSDDMQEGK